MASKSSAMHRNPEMVFSLIALALAALVGFAVWYWIGLNFYWVWLVAVNAVAFFLFRFDKRRAAKQNGRTRVPEVVLLGLTWLGGVVGAGLGMYMRPHHKTSKVHFVISLVLASILHAALLIWWLF
jgi:uncharacterized membrane protein YsdA (DUF1294 family)